jgi:hypothetical protein
MLVLSTIGVLLALYYMWNGYQVLEIKSHLGEVERDWAKVEPKVTASQKRSTELNDIISSTKVLDGMIESRFHWANFLEQLSRCVAPNTQLTNIDGAVLDEDKGVVVTIEGIAAGREPRAAAEDLRQMLLEQLSQKYHDVKVEFKTLEDLDTIVSVGGANMSMARYILGVSFNHIAVAPLKDASPAPTRARKQ